MSNREVIASVGAGRMGRGIAVVFAYAGHTVHLIDVKDRPAADVERLRADALAEIEGTLRTLAGLGMMAESAVAPIVARVHVAGLDGAAEALAQADVIFEGVPETLDAKRHAFSVVSRHAR
ncbi:MAG TPA: 3-hydroxyacyl-CoA dehydrogenase NAD-binding domain-containing protein, partial [Xanthobacteraceae bacterium]|nr:3-hydroxyacyl-CoA dehydrogenase NAD-binding domain-containing protein [Xanthobacteraceae bacterium]